MIEIRDLTKVYRLNKKQMAESHTKNPKKTAVDHLSLTAKKGEIYGLLGPNGAGKTTTLRCISTIIRPTSGEIYVDGHEVQKEPEAVRNSIGFLTSDIKLDDQFDADYMFRFFGRLHKVPEDVLKKRRDELFDYFGISEFAHKKIKELSTGMKQKAAIAVSLVHDPDIVIFDEPTNGLDREARQRLTDILCGLDTARIVISHDWDFLSRVCDSYMTIREGRLMPCAPDFRHSHTHIHPRGDEPHWHPDCPA